LGLKLVLLLESLLLLLLGLKLGCRLLGLKLAHCLGLAGQVEAASLPMVSSLPFR